MRPSHRAPSQRLEDSGELLPESLIPPPLTMAIVGIGHLTRGDMQGFLDAAREVLAQMHVVL